MLWRGDQVAGAGATEQECGCVFIPIWVCFCWFCEGSVTKGVYVRPGVGVHLCCVAVPSKARRAAHMNKEHKGAKLKENTMKRNS